MFPYIYRETLPTMQTTLPPDLAREVAPPGHWKQENEDEKTSLVSSVQAWLEGVTANERLFQIHVYDNPDLGDLDLRQHRARLHSLLADGELLGMKLIEFRRKASQPREAQVLFDRVEQKRQELFSVLFGWHGPLDAQADVPPSFKEAAREASAGRVVDLDL